MYQSLEDKVEALKRAGKLTDAMELLKKMLVKDPTNEFALLQMADMHYAGGELDAAIKPIDFLLARNPTNAMALYVKGVVYMEQEKRHDAKDAFSQAMHGHNESNPEILRCYALTEQALGNRERAREYLEKAFEINSHDAEIIANLVEMYLSIDDFTRVGELIRHYDAHRDLLETFGKDPIVYDHKISIAKKRLLSRLQS